MRTFIVSDLHGCGDVYNSIISYLNNIYLRDNEDVHLYINGDLIDRGPDGLDMLLDVKSRVEGNSNIKITYLAGNHELLFCDAMLAYNEGALSDNDPWLNSGGNVTLKSILSYVEYLILNQDDIKSLIKFLLDLDIYKVFPNSFCGNPILLVHACAPDDVYENCHLKLIDIIYEFNVNPLEYRGENVGKNGYLTIIGHTPTDNEHGFSFFSNGNYLNIDGGCAEYTLNPKLHAHVPLVEIKDDGYLEILTFNENNEIIYGEFFNGEHCTMSEEDLNKRRSYLDFTNKMSQF